MSARPAIRPLTNKVGAKLAYASEARSVHAAAHRCCGLTSTEARRHLRNEAPFQLLNRGDTIPAKPSGVKRHFELIASRDRINGAACTLHDRPPCSKRCRKKRCKDLVQRQ